MSFCIPKDIAKTLKKAAARGEITIDGLYNMSLEQRIDFFANYTDKLIATEIGMGFEEAKNSSIKESMETWVRNTFNPKAQASAKGIIEDLTRIEDRNLTPEAINETIQELVSAKMGLTITPEEVSEINKRATELKSTFNSGVDEFGNRSEEYFIKLKEMQDYMKSLTPSSNLKVFTGTIGKGAMLFNLKSPITNIVGNTIQGIEQSFERRVASGQYAGAVDKEVIKNYVNKAKDVYKKSGFDLSRMYEYSDGQKILGEKMVHSEGKGNIRKLGRIYEDVVFGKLLGAPDVAFARASFVDSLNLASTKIARKEGLTGEALKARATELFKKGAMVETNGEGIALREQAISDAMFATFQNDSVYSETSLKIRELLNKATGDFRVGDLVMPFVKTPANVAGMALDVSGLGLIRGVMQLRTAVPAFKAGNPKPLQDATRLMVRTGLGSLAAFVVSMLIDPDDFVGFWPTDEKEQELLKLQGANSNSVKIGGKWISLDYFGFMGGSLVGMLYARKYGGNLTNVMFNYALGAGKEQLMQIPGIEESNQIIADLDKMQPGDLNAVDELKGKALLSAIDFIRSRSIPGIVNDIAKALDTSEREVDWKNPMQKVQATIPGWRNALPEKVDVFGDVIRGEPWWSDVLFGARMKTNRDSEIADEITRLDDVGFIPSLTRPEETSPRFKALKEQVGEQKFSEAMGYFRGEYKKQVYSLIKSSKYKNLKDEEKKEEIDNIKSALMDKTLKRYNYKK